MKEAEDHPILDSLLVDAMKEGKSSEIAASMMTPNITAAVLFLRGHAGGEDPISKKEQRHGVDAGNFVRLAAWVSAHKIAARVLPGDDAKESRESLAGAIACQIIAAIGCSVVSRACEIKDPVALSLHTQEHAALILDGLERHYKIPKAPPK